MLLLLFVREKKGEMEIERGERERMRERVRE